MEKIDRQILGLLADDGRMSYTDLGKATGLSTSAVHQRVKRLEERGLILGYGATIDHAAAGKPLTAFVSITPFDPSETDDYPDRLEHDHRDRVVLVGGGGGVLHPQGAGRDARRARGPARPGPRGGQRLHAHHDRALHALREPPHALTRLRETDPMSGEVLAVFLAVVGGRFVLPLFIPRYPLPAIIGCLVLDGVDQTIFQAFGYDPPGYQGYDKAMDVYYLAIAYLATMRNWVNLGAFRVGRFLYFYRLVGVVAFELAQIRALLLIFAEHLRVLLHRLRGRALALVDAAVLAALVGRPRPR